MEDDSLFGSRLLEMKPPKRRRWLFVVVAVLAALLLFGSRLLEIYIDALWFSSLGYASAYWYKFRLGAALFAVFFVLAFLIIRLPMALMSRSFPELTERPRLKITSIEEIGEVNFLPFIFRPGVWILSVGVALLSATSMSQNWSTFALYLNAQQARSVDPIFNKDVGFYLFKLPAAELVSGWFVTLSVILFLAVSGSAAYIWYLERTRGEGSTFTRRRSTTAISAAGAFFALALAVSTYFGRFDLLHGTHELFTGVNYTDANVRLTSMNVLIGLLVLSAVLLAVNAFVIRKPRVIIWLAGAVIAVWVLGLVVIPQLVQSFSVKPNELAKEAPYIENNIEQTRHAFAIDRFEEKPFQPSATPTVEQLQANRETVENVRLWDRRALQAILSQIQEIRTYYEFNEPDVDRYIVNGTLKQVMLTTRELNVEQLPEQSRNWINQHLIYTHGYGVTMNSVNEFTPEGQPRLLLKNMPVETEVPEIKITRPEVYFGEETNWHVYVRTRPQGSTPPEFNYPAPDDTDSYTTYEGDAGIEVGGFFRKLALSLHLGDGTNLLFSDYINPDSRVLMRRNITERARRIAPFLLFENDPYLVISRDGKLYWVIDAFTTSDRFPYATQYQTANRAINYIRNSVKVVVDAYEGHVRFYVFDEPDDPIIRTYQSIFPAMFQSSSEMPSDLREHVRYPSQLMDLQARVYTLYHMTNVQTFYNHEDLWSLATGEQPAQAGAEASAMQPYHVLMKLPGEEQSPIEFANVLPFTPAGPGRSNMIGWLAARSDGPKYGKARVYSFPKNVTIHGPAQVRARVNQDPQLSQQMTLWNQQGSQLLRGNLLVIPIGDSVLYVESFFLQAAGAGSKLPELRQVIIASQDRLVAAKNFDEALALLFPSLPQRQTPQPDRQTPTEAQTQARGQPTPSSSAPVQGAPVDAERDRLARQAQQLFSEYERLAAAGKHREAGEKLDQLKQTLERLNRRR